MEIEPQLLQDVVNYLVTRPFREVNSLLVRLAAQNKPATQEDSPPVGEEEDKED